jgi:hypothetical protein
MGMTLTRAFFTGYLPFSPVKIDVEGMAQHGVHAIFRARPLARTPRILCQMERRDRAVLILLDGKRTIGEVARLVHRSELEVARTLVRLLERGYVEFLGA